MINLEYSMTDTQQELFFDTQAQIKIIPKGRRFGLTQGAAYWMMDCAMTLQEPYYLWGDVSYGNIQRYFERYWLPLLKKHKIKHRFNKTNWQLSFDWTPTVIDFRSAEHPASWEGFGYNKTFLNEAGIILKNKYIWENCIRIMMLDYPDAEMIIGGTPKGTGGTYEELYLKAVENPGRFWQHTYTTYDNPILSRKAINELMEDIPSSVVQQEIYGKFIKPEDTIVDRAWIKYQEPPDNCTYKMFCDLAISKKTTADYTAICVLGKDPDGNLFVADIYRDKLSTVEARNKIVQMAAKWELREVGVEVVAYQEAMAEMLERETNLHVIRYTPTTDKVSRFYPFAARIERGLVFFSKKLPSYYEKELLEFPSGEHDDMVDATSGAYEMFNEVSFNIYASGF